MRAEQRGKITSQARAVTSLTRCAVRASCSLKEEEPGAEHYKASRSSDLANKGPVSQYLSEASRAGPRMVAGFNQESLLPRKSVVMRQGWGQAGKSVPKSRSASVVSMAGYRHGCGVVIAQMWVSCYSLSLKAASKGSGDVSGWGLPAELPGNALPKITRGKGGGASLSCAISKLALSPGSQISRRRGCSWGP